ncbi:MAG: DUF1016 N-terminal domain-containing protein [Bacillota bacterium]|nr:DUF1016 N-terminal domain-containing protein [Bacillota bacterium]
MAEVYCRRDLSNMVSFYEAFGDFKIVYTLSAQLTWSHIKKFISIEDNIKREFYATMCNTMTLPYMFIALAFPFFKMKTEISKPFIVYSSYLKRI